MSFDRTAVLALHWQVNVIEPQGFFGVRLAEPVRRSGVVERAAAFHAAAQQAGVPLIFGRFTVPEGEGSLVRNTGFMRAVAEAQLDFRPESAGAQIISAMAEQAGASEVCDTQKLSCLAGNDLPQWLAARNLDTLLITGVATNMVVEQTARHGIDLGFTVYPIADCVSAATEQIHEAALANLELLTTGCLSADEALKQLRA